MISKPEKSLADCWEYKGIVINTPDMTTWGASLIVDNHGVYHLFAAR